MSGPPSNETTSEGNKPFRWWFEEDIDEELETEHDLRLGYEPSPGADPDADETPGAEAEADEEAPDELSEPAPEVTGDETSPDVPRRSRTARATSVRRRRLLTLAAGAAVLGLLAAAAVAVDWTRLRPGADTTQNTSEHPSARPAAAVDQDTLLLVRHGGQDSGPALGITLLARSADAGAVIFVPQGTIVDIPGFGQDRLGLAYQYGGVALVEATLENLLGVDIDHAAAVSNSGLSALIGRTGGLDIEVDQRLVARTAAGAGRVRFEPGPQFLDGERLVEFWDFRQRRESELDTFPRQQLVWAALLSASSDPQVVEALTSDGAPQLDTSAGPEFLASVLTGLADAQNDGALEYTLLPVTPFGAADDSGTITYKPDPEGVTRLVEGPLADSVPGSATAEGLRIQVLNGVGTPGIGQEVDSRLEGGNFRIVLTDNARSFDFAETRILIYAEDERSLAAAEQVQRRLGVGTIQLSRQPQSVVDLTIVVGADFLAEKRTDGDPFPEPKEQSS